jgi:ABC-2 type transport system permease protein
MKIKMEKFVFFLRLFKMPMKWIGVDYDQFEILLCTKLTMDFRNSPAGLQAMDNKKRTMTNQLFMYLVFGFLFGFAAFSVGDLGLSLTIFFSVIMVSLTMTLVSEFTTVLFDQRDNFILLPRPVSNRTLLMLRLVHIQFYMGLIALALSFPTGIIIVIKYNVLTALIYFIAVALCTWISLIFTTFIYLMLSRIVNGERFKDLISYAQIIMAVAVFGSYQLIPRVMDTEILKNASLTVQWWTWLFPPAWLAALVTVITSGSTLSFKLLALPGVVVPVAGAIILMRSMSKGFGNILSDASSESSASQNTSELKRGLLSGLNNFFCSSEYEKAGWEISMATMKRDRKFKQSVYPNFGIMIVLAIIVLKPDLSNILSSLKGNDEFGKYFFVMMLGFSVNAAILQLPYTDTPEAAWIYKALPFTAHGDIISGATKAMLAKFLIPIYIIITIPSVLLWGIPFVSQILLSVLGNILLVLIIVSTRETLLPFTRVREMQQKGINTIRGIFSMIFMVMMAGLIYATRFIPIWITVAICSIVYCCIILIFRSVRKRKIKFA